MARAFAPYARECAQVTNNDLAVQATGSVSFITWSPAGPDGECTAGCGDNRFDRVPPEAPVLALEVPFGSCSGAPICVYVHDGTFGRGSDGVPLADVPESCYSSQNQLCAMCSYLVTVRHRTPPPPFFNCYYWHRHRPLSGFSSGFNACMLGPSCGKGEPDRAPPRGQRNTAFCSACVGATKRPQITSFWLLRYSLWDPRCVQTELHDTSSPRVYPGGMHALQTSSGCALSTIVGMPCLCTCCRCIWGSLQHTGTRQDIPHLAGKQAHAL